MAGMDTPTSPIEAAIVAMGGATAAARMLGIDNPSVVMNWRSRGRPPADRVIEIEAASGISRHDLRPDIFGPSPERASA